MKLIKNFKNKNRCKRNVELPDGHCAATWKTNAPSRIAKNPSCCPVVAAKSVWKTALAVSFASAFDWWFICKTCVLFFRFRIGTVEGGRVSFRIGRWRQTSQRYVIEILFFDFTFQWDLEDVATSLERGAMASSLSTSFLPLFSSWLIVLNSFFVYFSMLSV